jgi:hypothetical protein
VPTTRAPQLDRTIYITPDSKEYWLDAPGRSWVLTEDGFGMPPIDWVTERGPFQHGESVKDFFFRPMVMQLIVRKNGCSRSEYWTIRNEILDMLRPGRGDPEVTPGILRKYLASGVTREWEVYASEGPSFQARQADTWDEWSVSTTIRFTAFDPIARDPKQKTQTYSASAGAGGTFPLTFPIQFAGGFSSGVSNISYVGTWDAYPDIVFTGPMLGPSVVNNTTQEKIQLTMQIPAGRVVTASLKFGRKLMTLDDGTNVIGYVTSDSDLSSFHLKPGTNSMSVSASGTSGASSVQLKWFDRYVGI